MKEMAKTEAMRYVVEHPFGNIDELRQVIGEERLREFEYLGYIRNGISQSAQTYRKTATIQNDFETFVKKPSAMTVIPSVIFGSLAKLFA